LETNRRRKSLSICITTLILTACSITSAFSDYNDRESIYEIAKKLESVESIAESEVRFGKDTISSKDIIKVISEEDSELLSYFDDLYLDFKIVNKHVSAIACDKDRKYLIAEDSNCTAEIDRNAVKDGKQPCSFELDLTKICKHK